MGETTDVEFIATRLSLVPMKGDKAPRKVVITQGCDPTVVAIRGTVTKYPVIALPKEKLDSAMSSPAILGMGNPLLDISAEVTQATFDKYGLEPGNAILAED